MWNIHAAFILRKIRNRGEILAKQQTLSTIDETRDWYLRKYKQFGYEVEDSVLPSGLALNCDSNTGNKMSGIPIFRGNRKFHEKAP